MISESDFIPFEEFLPWDHREIELSSANGEISSDLNDAFLMPHLVKFVFDVKGKLLLMIWTEVNLDWR